MNDYIGRIRLVGFTFAPPGYLPCDGSLLAISQYDALFALIGTTYGGDGVSTFGLPDLRGRVPLHYGTGAGQTYALGQMAGSETVTLVTGQLPAHPHPAGAGGAAGTNNPSNAVPGATLSTFPFYAPAGGAPVQMAGVACGPTGNNQPHDNMQPYLVATFMICVEGVFPTRN